MNRYIQYMYSYPHKTAYRPLHGIRLEDYLAPCKDMQNSLYFHVPFCEAKCGYCNLFSVTRKREADCDAYLDAMERQAEQIAHVLPCGMHFSDLTLGGGTPLYLNERQLQRIFSMARHYFGFRKGDGPILVETSPRQTTTEKLQLLKENGTTRISIGVQSFHANELHTLQRIHTPADAREALQRIRKVGFSCVNLDLIYGIPDQTEESLHRSLQEALTFAPEELFVYPLYIKKGTRLERAGATTSPHTYLLYRFVRDYLKKHGYQPSSMRRFAKATPARDTVTAPCGFDNTLSIGCGGRSYLSNLHTCTPYSISPSCCNTRLQEYMETTDFLTVPNGFLLSAEEMRRRYVIKNILFGTGIHLESYARQFHSDPRQDYPVLQDWQKQGYAVETSGCFGLTEEGFACSDFLGPMLISKEVSEKMKAWSEDL